MRVPWRLRRKEAALPDDPDQADADQADAEGAAADGTGADGAEAPLVPAVRHADRFTFQDLVAEATADIGSRPARLVMTILGTVLGIASLVATIGFAQTAAAQIARQFDGAAATQVVVTAAQAQTGAQNRTVAAGRLPWDSPSG